MSSHTVKLQLPDPDLVRQTLSSLPFHSVEGVINFRDFGILSFPHDLTTINSYEKSLEIPRIRPGVLFRSGELARLTEKGQAKIKELGITTVFDLRSESEIHEYKSATPEIDGVRFVRVPVGDKDEYNPMALGAKVAKFASDEKNAFATLYHGILENAGPAYETILKHIRDRPGESFLVHCTAGKDRTGIFAAIVQLLLGVPDEAIAHDYNLTTYGLAPALPALTERFQKVAIYRDNWEGFQNMGSAKTETMLATLDLIRSKYGSAEGYIKTRTSLTDSDITRIRRNLLLASHSHSHSHSTSASPTKSAKLELDADVREKSDVVVVVEHGKNNTVMSVLRDWLRYVCALFGWIWRAVL